MIQRAGIWPGLLLLWLVALLVGILTRPLIPVDELRYTAVAWEMWARGDFLVPYLNGEPYSHKPPLFFWLIHAGWWLFGVNEWSARLLAPLLTLLALFATARLAGRLWPDDAVASRLSAPVMFASVFLVAFFTWLQIDLLLVLLVVLAMTGVIDAAQGRRSGWVLAGVALGLGVLAKGPVILLHVLPPALLAPLWKADGPACGWRRWYAGLLAAVALAALIALAWAVPAAAAGGEAYGQAILWGQTAGRVVQSFAHAHPLWWYLPWLFVLFAPWILLPWLWGALRSAWSRRDEGLRFCVTWLVTVLLLLSLISGKQLKYLLPLLPAFALLVARALSQMDTQAVRQRPWLLTLVLLVVGLVGMFAPRWLTQAAWLNTVHPGWGFSLLVCAVVLWWLKPVSPQQYPLRMVLLSVLVVCIGELGVLRIGAPAYDVHAASQLVARAQSDSQLVAVREHYHGEFTFPGRLQQPVVQLAPGEATDWAIRNPEGYLVLTGDDLPEEYPRAIYNRPWRSGRMVIVRGDVMIPYNDALQDSK
jgi:4-amino-4-deoxy-L-arabinose transferase-like glycosyltransferase